MMKPYALKMGKEVALWGHVRVWGRVDSDRRIYINLRHPKEFRIERVEFDNPIDGTVYGLHITVHKNPK